MPVRQRPWQLGKFELGTLAPTTTPSEIGFLGLLRDRSRRSWTVPNVLEPGQTRNDERKFVKKRRNPIKRERVKRRLGTVVWLSDRDHLFTGESGGYEGPFERDGTTRQGHGRKWHVEEVGCTG
ncbi:hypothetical protein CDL15_Pgr023840 [Punica granatum]|uniref:Uncharacterized protein n=1 Tax=Punica granatum TaxID=22663 RepID=A0A218VZU4_PUNGR|nr:hypothetical protein CDL15_Pgr023840 [Punica granatum]PKI59077.1 hypothetical protein CRG98_020532 [Punica granatum]